MNCRNNLKSILFISSLLGLVGCADLNNSGFQAASWVDSSVESQEALSTREAFSYSYADEASEEKVSEEDVIEEQGEIVFTPPPKSEMDGPGVLKPTVYYFAVINEDTNGCSKDQKRTLYGAGGKKLLEICSKTMSACSLQGSCGIIQDGKLHTYNIIGKFNGQERYFEVDEEKCPFGYGVKSSCLDPFYTLAADLAIYKPGEVIYIPSIVGLELPDGSKHDGYFVIRDQGRAIKGRGRFDFFSGYMSWYDSQNPFKKVGLGNVKTNIPYFRISGRTAKKVLNERAYPLLPENVVNMEIK
ncbi:hypothetical protein BDW_12030 [Bdellovibrio bacteriovorus W]|nr:hypothetical protein BDW_12030 [Bdellovibrio bacteriovorus W]